MANLLVTKGGRMPVLIPSGIRHGITTPLLGVRLHPAFVTPLKEPFRITIKAETGVAFRMLEAADRNFRQLHNAFLTMIRTVKSQIRMRELEEALQMGLSAVLQLLDLERRMSSIAAGAGLAVGETGFSEALLQTFRDGAEEAVVDLDKVPVRKQSVGATMAFDAVDPNAMAFLANYNFNLIREVSQETQLAIGEVVSTAFQEGGHPRTQARAIRNMVGLTRNQTRAVENFRRMLESGDPAQMQEAMTRALRDRRFDSTVLRAMRRQVRLAQPRINQMVDRYYNRSLKYRAENIARTETIRASHMGQEAAWQQATQQGLLAPDTRRKWINTPDFRTCKICRPIPALNRAGVPIGESFQTPVGPRERPPAHPSCRCTLGLIIPRGRGI